jgi:hypothetical protein
MPDPTHDWDALNDRQRAYLTAIFERDQVIEKSARTAWLDGVRTGDHPPAAGWDGAPNAELGWRWLRWGADAALEGDGLIRRPLRDQGQLDQGAGSTLAALERRGLLGVRSRLDRIMVPLRGPVLIDVVYVMLAPKGRAAARAGLGVAATPASRRPKGLLSEFLWGALASLYAAGEEGVDSLRRAPTTWRFLEDRREGSFATFVWGGALDGRYQLSELGRQHYELHWPCYQELYADVAAPRPADLAGAHAGLADHRQHRPRDLLSEQLWTVLAALAEAELNGNPVYEGRARAQHSDLIRDRLPVPGLMEWQVARLARTSKAVERLRRHRAGALVEVVEVSNPHGHDHDRPLPILRLSELGRRHYREHLAAYRTLHPLVSAPGLGERPPAVAAASVTDRSSGGP